MCGIAGIIGGGDRPALERMADIMAHRGPDDQGVEWFGATSSGLAHRRLSILDLSPAGHQPMANSRGNRWLTYNGEIYNFPELRRELESLGHRFRSSSDTEMILAAYDEWGEDCVRRFNGMFAFAIYEPDSDELFLARDHLGIKPLYYLQRGPMLAFASEAKALFEIDGVEKSVNPDAVVSSLLFLWVPEPATGYNGVLKLPAGHTARFSRGRLTLKEYWDIPTHDTMSLPERSEADYTDELCDILERVVARQMLSDVPVGAFLSGGLDSSILVALMRKVNAGQISTYTIGFTERDKQMEAMPDDAKYARLVAEKFGTSHHEIIVDPDINEDLRFILHHLDDPVLDGAAINTWLISKAAKDAGTTVLLNGMGGDEVFGGYRKQLASLLIEKYLRLPGFIRRGMIEPIADRLPVAIAGRGIRSVRWGKKFLRSVSDSPLGSFMTGFGYYTPAEMRELLSPELARTPFEDLYPVRRYRETAARVEGLPLIDQMTYLDSKLFLPGINLIYSDKATMAASVEGRPPLIDIELVEFAARLPGKYKINGRTQKYLLKKAAERYLPHEVIYRPKAAFGTPIRAWMKQGLVDEVREAFRAIPERHAGYLRPQLPNQLLREHIAGTEDHAHQLWGLLALCTWLDLQKSGVGSRLPAV
jgi:asparagine synthase (glutamine-hydrolysing)